MTCYCYWSRLKTLEKPWLPLLFCKPPLTNSREHQMSSSVYRRLQDIFTSTKSLAKISKPIPKPETLSPVSPKGPNYKRIALKFKKLSDSAHFRRRHDNYQSTVRRLAAAKQFSYIQDILEHQKKYPEINTETFAVRLISLYGKSGMFDHAYRVFDEMPKFECERTVMSFNALLAACVNSNKFDKMSELFRDLPEKLSIEPNVVSYNTVINAFCKMGSLDSALLVIDKMEKNGIEPDSISFNTLLDAFYKCNQFSQVEKLWGVMESKNVLPNVRSYNAKLRGLVAENRISEAAKLIEEMRSSEVKPDVFSFNSLIKGSVEDGNLDEAKRWYAELMKDHSVADKVTYNLLISLACEKEDLDFAREMCVNAIKHRCVVDTNKLQLVVDLLGRVSRTEEAAELVALGTSCNYFRYKLKSPTPTPTDE